MTAHVRGGYESTLKRPECQYPGKYLLREPGYCWGGTIFQRNRRQSAGELPFGIGSLDRSLDPLDGHQVNAFSNLCSPGVIQNPTNLLISTLSQRKVWGAYLESCSLSINIPVRLFSN